MNLKSQDRLDSDQMLALLDRGMGKYLYVNVISKRCKQLIAGSPKLAEPPRECCLLADGAAEEIRQNKLSVRPLGGNKLIQVPADIARSKGAGKKDKEAVKKA